MNEQILVDEMIAAGLRLRFDKVVIRVVAQVKAALADGVPMGQCTIFTLTAPIRLPAKTAADLAALARDVPAGGRVDRVLHGNAVQVRRLTGLAATCPRVLGWVHNRETPAERLFDIAESWLRAGR